MKKAFCRIDNDILNFTIDYLQEHQADELYNQVICKELGITRHTLYNHYENIKEIYDKILKDMSGNFKNDIQKSEILEENVLSTLLFLKKHRKEIIAVKKIDPEFTKKELQNIHNPTLTHMKEKLNSE